MGKWSDEMHLASSLFLYGVDLPMLLAAWGVLLTNLEIPTIWRILMIV